MPVRFFDIHGLSVFGVVERRVQSTCPRPGESMHTQTATTDVDWVRRALQGDATATSSLVRHLRVPVERAIRALLRQQHGRYNLCAEVEDATQGAMMALFTGRTPALSRWEPNRGLSLRSFAALVAKRHTLSMLDSRRRNPWSTPVAERELPDVVAPGSCVERRLAARQLWSKAVEEVEASLSPRGVSMLRMLFVEQLSADEVRARASVSRSCAHQWASRLRRCLRVELERVAACPRVYDVGGGRLCGSSGW